MPSQDLNQPNPSSEERGSRSALPASHYAYRDHWAIVVGISTYKHEAWNLKYAGRDATMFYELIQKPSCGGYKKDHIVKLIDEEATTVAITRALRNFLKKPQREDLVLIYLACHGAPDPDIPENTYLITYDTDPSDICSTALPMREILMSLQENSQVERKIIIADTCHSGVIGGGLRGSNETEPVNRFWQRWSETQPGLALLSSARSNEVSREDACWGGGHGVFTYFLLEGMKGAAPISDGFVTVGELWQYVKDKVEIETGNKQHPHISPGAIYDWPMAWVGSQSAQEHLHMGQYLYELGRRLDDKCCYMSAIHHYDLALKFAAFEDILLPEASLGRNQALIAANNYKEAIEDLNRLVQRTERGEFPRKYLYLGVAFAKLKQYDLAATALETFQLQAPQDEMAAWAGDYAQSLRQRRYAILIGISNYSNNLHLEGPKNDIQAMHDLLVEYYGFLDENISVIFDQEATREAILKAIRSVADKSCPQDIVVVYFSGCAESAESDNYLAAYDSKFGEKDLSDRLNFITVTELHNGMNAIPALNTVLIIDSNPSARLLELAGHEAKYALFMAAKPGQQAREIEGHGMFTLAFVQQLQHPSMYFTQGQLLEKLLTNKIFKGL